MPDVWTTRPLTTPFDAVVDLPGSKSLTNRALMLAALSTRATTLHHALDADDTRHMVENLVALGLSVDRDGGTLRVDPAGSPDFATRDADLFCGNSGTTLRFLAALLAAAGEGRFVLRGEPRMHERPAGPLVGLLESLGVKVDSRDGYPPLTVHAAGGLEGGTVRYAADGPSSQYLSSVLMAAPYARREARVELEGVATSWPYVTMTMRLMDHFGVTPELERDLHTDAPSAVVVPRGRYAGGEYHVEPDASAASYFLALAAVHPDSRVTLRRLGTESLQGDVRFAGVLGSMGCDVRVGPDTTTLVGPGSLHGVDVDLADTPDVAQTLAVVALFATGETTIRGIHTLRVKETDRVAALSNELERLGAGVSVHGEGRSLAMTVTPPVRPRAASVATYNDHRMAMSFAVAATRSAGIAVEDPSCVNKTFPGYFHTLAAATTSRG